jgi:hypothetical protein
MSCRKSVVQLAVGIALGAVIVPPAAFACGGIFDPCSLTHGGLSPGNIFKQGEKAVQDTGKTLEKASQDVGNAINELQASALSGPTLEQAIIASHTTAVNGAMPIPPFIRQ